MIQRTTELRHLEASQVHEISLILDENDGWKRIMSTIPKNYDAVSCSFDGSVDWNRLTDEVGYKYTNDQIREIAMPRQGDSRLPAEIFIDEWSTSGRKENRPTVGVLLQLLVKAELFRAADHVAEKWLCEPPPTRPNAGPAARINIELPSEIFNQIESFANDSTFQPATEDLVENAIMMNGKLDNNQDFYTKFRYDEKNWSTIDNTPPKPAPRKNRKSERIQSREQSQNNQSIAESNATKTATINGSINGEHEETTATVNGTTESTETNTTQHIPLLPVFFSHLRSNDAVTSNSADTESTVIESSVSIPLLSALQLPVKSDAIMTDVQNLPNLSALNLNGQPHSAEHSESNSPANQQNGELYDNDSNDADDDNDENSLSKLDSSNNNSSLTNVTGTSGENSFELSSSSTSNENIPLHVLQY